VVDELVTGEVLHREVVDGVAVFWARSPGPLTAGLVIGMGLQHEEFRANGVGHAVEHLAMSAVPRSHLDRNASIGLTETEFTATGPVDAVVEFLGQVCAALADLPLTRLEREAGVLDAESGLSTNPAHGAALALRFGYCGLGLAPLGTLPAASLTPEQVRAHAQRFAARGNAAVYLSGPVPPGLTLPLSPGHAPVTPGAPVVLGPKAPGWVSWDTPWPVLSYLGPDGPARRGGDRILIERLVEQLRHEEGLVYDIRPDVVVLGDDLRLTTLAAECRVERSAYVAERMWAVATELAATGPTDAEFAHDLEGLRAHFADPRSALSEAMFAACESVAGRTAPSRQELVRGRKNLTAHEVADSLAEALRTAYVIVPRGQQVAGGLVELQGCPLSGTAPDGAEMFSRRRRSEAPRGTALFLVPDGIGFRDVEGRHDVVRWADCVGVAVDGDIRLVTSRQRCAVLVDPCDWRDGMRAVAAVDRHIPSELFYRLD
jgi:predicted Zn-dependent peptidase